MARTPVELQTIAPRSRRQEGVNTFVQHAADPNAGAGLASIAKALGIAADVFGDKDTDKQKEYENNLQYYANQFAHDRDIGLVDATQVGAAYPDASPIVSGKITELVGKQWANSLVRSRFDEFLSDDSRRLDPDARRQFFTGLRSEIAEQVKGRPFFGNGAVSAAESIIREYESGFQRESAVYNSKLQEEDFKSNITDALLGQPVSISVPKGGAVVSSVDGSEAPENFRSTSKYTQDKTLALSAQFGRPLKITPHGGTQADRRKSTSQHHKGTATDLYIADLPDDEKTRLVALAIANGAKGLGAYSAGDGVGTLHVDYRKGGKHFADQVEGGLSLWHRQKAGVDSSWETGPEWFRAGIQQGLQMRQQGDSDKVRGFYADAPVGLMGTVMSAEAKGNYNAYFGNSDNTSIRFTDMTVDEVLAWQKQQIAGGSISSAVGGYQIKYETLRELKTKMKLSGDERFDQNLQDVLGHQLMKRRGLDDYKAGRISKEEFANNLAKEWAALPLVSGDNAGLSYYHGDSAGNRAQVSIDEFMAAIDSNETVDPVAFLDQQAGATSSINPIRRRELVVDTAIDLAMSKRDTSILDRIPTNMRGMPEIEAKIAKAQEQVRDLTWQDYVRQNQLKETQRTEGVRNAKQEILDRVAAGERIDPSEYTKHGDEVYNFANQVMNDDFTDPVKSAAQSARIRDAILQGATVEVGGHFLSDLTMSEAINSLMEAPDLTVQDRQKLISDLPELLDGMNLINDPQVSSFYTNRVGVDVQGYLQSVTGKIDKLVGTNIAGSVRKAYDETVRLEVRASIEDGTGIPRGKALLEILDKAEEKALKKLESLQRFNMAGNDNTPRPTKPSTSGKATYDPTPEEEGLLNKYLKGE